MESLVDTYKRNVSLGKIQREKAQEELLTRFDALRISVQNEENFVFKVYSHPRNIRLGRRGLWKSMIMDMFVASLKVVRRVHFHSLCKKFNHR